MNQIIYSIETLMVEPGLVQEEKFGTWSPWEASSRQKIELMYKEGGDKKVGKPHTHTHIQAR